MDPDSVAEVWDAPCRWRSVSCAELKDFPPLNINLSLLDTTAVEKYVTKLWSICHGGIEHQGYRSAIFETILV
jgi:hypothetical protein